MLSKIKKKLHLFKISEVPAFFLFPLFVPYALALKISGRKIFLVCERREEARDNGLAFFLYCMEHVTEYECFYAIDKASSEYRKLQKYADHVIQFGSIRHWAYYLACKANISSQKHSGPTILAGLVFRKMGLMNHKMIFLQHGVTKDDLIWLHYPNTHFAMFCCGAYPEYRFVEENYGYPKNVVCYTGGMCRYDRLHHISRSGKPYVLMMPTWREWLNSEIMMKKVENTDVFEETQYYKAWYGLLNNEKLEELAVRYGFEVRFYLHPMMKKMTRYFKSALPSVTVCSDAEWDLQELLPGASMLVTDYSSVYFDMIYMQRPVAFFQFDTEKYRKNQYAEGYFKYEDNPFGKSVDNEEKLLKNIEASAAEEFRINEEFRAGHHKYFPLWDDQNCKRTYEEIKKHIKKC